MNFLNQYEQAGGDLNLIGGTIMADQSVLTAKGQAKEALKGTPTSGPQADDWDNDKWHAFVKEYQESFPENERFPTPSLFATGYYNATIAVLKALEAVNGELDEDQANFRAALAEVELDAPNGKITLDDNRQAIGSVFISEVVEGEDGNLVSKFVSKVDDVNQTLGMTPEEFRAIGLPGRDTPKCE